MKKNRYLGGEKDREKEGSGRESDVDEKRECGEIQKAIDESKQ